MAYRFNEVFDCRASSRRRDRIRQICAAREVIIVRCAVSPDQIHLPLAAPPILALAKLARHIRGRSSRRLRNATFSRLEFYRLSAINRSEAQFAFPPR